MMLEREEHHTCLLPARVKVFSGAAFSESLLVVAFSLQLSSRGLIRQQLFQGEETDGRRERADYFQSLRSIRAPRDADDPRGHWPADRSDADDRELPWGGTYNGQQSIMDFATRLLQHLDSRVDVEELVEAGERIIMLGYTRGHVRSNNREFDLRAVHIWTLKDGKAVRFEAYIDTPKMLEALNG